MNQTANRLPARTGKPHPHIRRSLVLFGTLCAFAFLFSVDAYALSDAEVITALERFEFPQNNIISYICRWLGWNIIRGIRFITNGIEEALYGLTGSFTDLFTDPDVQSLLNDKLMPLMFVLLVLVILFIGIQYMIKPPSTTVLIKNLVVGIIVAVSLPLFVSSAFQITTQAIDFLGADQAETLSDQLLLDNVTDLLQYDKQGFGGEPSTKSFYHSNSDGAGISRIDIVEMIDPDDTQHDELWGSEVKTDSDGVKSVEKFDNGWIKNSAAILQDGYYRWEVNWLSLIVSLVVVGFAMMFLCIRIGKLLFELVIHQFLAQVVALLDIYSAERLKKCLQSLLSSFVTLFGCYFLLQYYLLAMRFVSGIESTMVQLILIVAASMLLMAGPNLFEQLFGQGTGGNARGSLSSTLFGAQAALSLGGVAKRGLIGTKGQDGHRHGGLIPGAASAAGQAAGAVGAAGGAVAGGIQGARDSRQQGSQNSSQQNNNSNTANSQNSSTASNTSQQTGGQSQNYSQSQNQANNSATENNNNVAMVNANAQGQPVDGANPQANGEAPHIAQEGDVGVPMQRAVPLDIEKDASEANPIHADMNTPEREPWEQPQERDAWELPDKHEQQLANQLQPADRQQGTDPATQRQGDANPHTAAMPQQQEDAKHHIPQPENQQQEHPRMPTDAPEHRMPQQPDAGDSRPAGAQAEQPMQNAMPPEPQHHNAQSGNQSGVPQNVQTGNQPGAPQNAQPGTNPGGQGVAPQTRNASVRSRVGQHISTSPLVAPAQRNSRRAYDLSYNSAVTRSQKRADKAARKDD